MKMAKLKEAMVGKVTYVKGRNHDVLANELGIVLKVTLYNATIFFPHNLTKKVLSLENVLRFDVEPVDRETYEILQKIFANDKLGASMVESEASEQKYAAEIQELIQQDNNLMYQLDVLCVKKLEKLIQEEDAILNVDSWYADDLFFMELSFTVDAAIHQKVLAPGYIIEQVKKVGQFSLNRAGVIAEPDKSKQVVVFQFEQYSVIPWSKSIEDVRKLVNTLNKHASTLNQ